MVWQAYQKTKLGPLAKFCCFMGMVLAFGCDGIQEKNIAERQPTTIPSDVDFSKLNPNDLHVNLRPTCELKPHADTNKRNLECELRTSDGSSIFNRIDGAEILVELENGDRSYLSVTLVQENGIWKLKTEFVVTHITDIKSMVLGVEQTGKTDFFEFKFEYENQIVQLSVGSGTGDTVEENGSIEIVDSKPALNFHKQPLRSPAYRVLTLTPNNSEVAARLDSVTSASPISGQPVAFKVFNNFSNPAMPKLDLENPSAGYCGKNISVACKLKFQSNLPDFTDDPTKPYTTDFTLSYHNGLSQSSLKIRVMGTGAMVATKVFGQIDFTSSSTAQIDGPSGVTVFNSNLYVVDTSGLVKVWNINNPGVAPTTIAGVSDQTDITFFDSTAYFSDASYRMEECSIHENASNQNFYGAGSIITNSDSVIGVSGVCNAVIVKKIDGSQFKVFGSNSQMPSAVSNASLSFPRYAAFLGPEIAISDFDRNRILIAPFSSPSLLATKVIGQLDFETGGLRPTAADTLNGPMGLAIWNDYLFVADSNNNRVLRFKISDLTESGSSAIEVAGQENFTSSSSPIAINSESFNSPLDLHAEGGFLYILDSGNNRVLSVPLSE